MSGSAFGSCDNGLKWTYDEEGNICVAGIPNCITGEDLKILAVPEDQFTTCVLSEDDTIATLTIPGKAEPLSLCLNPTKGAVLVASDGTETVLEVIDGIIQIPEPDSICWGFNDEGCPVVGIPNCVTGENLVIDQVQSVTGNVVDSTDSKNLIVTAVASVTGPGVTGTPTDPVIGQSGFSQDAATGDITHTAADGVSTTAQTRFSTTVPSPDGSIHTLKTDDDISTAVCANQFKGFRQDGNDYIVQLLNQAGDIVDGDVITTIVDTDQRLTNPRITQRTLAGITTHVITWDVVDIEGNVLGTEFAEGINVPVFRDKSGNTIQGPISPMITEEFEEGIYEVGSDKLMVLESNGRCKLVDRLEQVTVDSSDDSVTVTATGTGYDLSVANPSVLTPNGNPVDSDSTGNNIVTQCCTWVQLVDAEGNVTNPYSGEVTASGAPSGTTVMASTDSNGLGASVFCSPEGEGVLDVVCGEDANGVECEGVITHIIGDLKTRVPTKRVSQCSDSQSVSQAFVVRGDAVFPDGAVGTEDVDVMNSIDIIPTAQTMRFTLTKRSDVTFQAIWSMSARNASLSYNFEISVDGGAWNACSGGSVDSINFVTTGQLNEVYVPETCSLVLDKGDHTIEFRFSKFADSTILDPSLDTYQVRLANTSMATVRYSQDKCLEVTL